MSKFGDWMSEHEEVTGVLLTVLAAAVLGFTGYVVSAVISARPQESAIVADQTENAAETETAAESGSMAAESGEAQEETTMAAETTAAETNAPVQTTAAAAESYAAGNVINEYGVSFTITEPEQVTAVSETNLRSVPSTDSDDYIVVKIFNGDYVTRTGTSENGWSRVNYNGNTLYAATNLLTTTVSGEQAGQGE